MNVITCSVLNAFLCFSNTRRNDSLVNNGFSYRYKKRQTKQLILDKKKNSCYTLVILKYENYQFSVLCTCNIAREIDRVHAVMIMQLVVIILMQLLIQTHLQAHVFTFGVNRLQQIVVCIATLKKLIVQTIRNVQQVMCILPCIMNHLLWQRSEN